MDSERLYNHGEMAKSVQIFSDLCAQEAKERNLKN